MAMQLTDDQIDIDSLVSSYHKKKSSLLFLFIAISFIFIGTISGFFNLQRSNQQIDTYKVTAVELSVVTLESQRCDTHPYDPICVKAREIIANPDKAVNGLEKNPLYPNKPLENFYAFLNSSP